MRTFAITLLAIVITSCASSLPPAEPSPQMMDQADTVILSVEGEAGEAYRQLETYMGNQGYTVIRSTEQPLSFETRFKKYGPLMLRVLGGYSMKIRASVKENTIHFSALLASGTQVENSGGKNSPVNHGWNQLVELASGFPHQEIYYSRN